MPRLNPSFSSNDGASESKGLDDEQEISRLSLEALRRGDVDEWERLYLVADRVLLGYITKRSLFDKNICTSDIDDILANTYVNARSSSKDIDPTRPSILPWLKAIAKTQHLNHHRASMRRDRNTGGTANPILPNDMSLADNGNLCPETALALKEVLESLSPKDKALLQELIGQPDKDASARDSGSNKHSVQRSRLRSKLLAGLGLKRGDKQ